MVIDERDDAHTASLGLHRSFSFASLQHWRAMLRGLVL